MTVPRWGAALLRPYKEKGRGSQPEMAVPQGMAAFDLQGVASSDLGLPDVLGVRGSNPAKNATTTEEDA